MHRLITGITGSGKSRLVREVLIPAWRKRRAPVLVLDPIGQRWGDVQYQTADPWLFLEKAQKSKGCVLIIDECEESLRSTPKVERGLKYLATMSRNDGHVAYFLAQRALQIPPSYRNQCSWAYAFQQNGKDAAELCQLLNRPELLTVTGLPLGTFLHVRPGAKCVKIRLF